MAQNKKVLPHHPQDNESSEERQLLTRKKIAQICVDGNDPVSPDKLRKWLDKHQEAAAAKGWTNFRITIHTEPFEPYCSLEHNYIVLTGDRYETDEEMKKRLESVVSKWQREYEDFLRNKDFYENNPVGLARLEYIEEKKTRPINRPKVRNG